MVFLCCGVLPNISPEELAFWTLFSLILGVNLIHGKEQKGHLGVWEWPCSSVEAWLPSVMAPLCTQKALHVNGSLRHGHEMCEPRGLSHSHLLCSSLLPVPPLIIILPGLFLYRREGRWASSLTSCCIATSDKGTCVLFAFLV